MIANECCVAWIEILSFGNIVIMLVMDLHYVPTLHIISFMCQQCTLDTAHLAFPEYARFFRYFKSQIIFL